MYAYYPNNKLVKNKLYICIYKQFLNSYWFLIHLMYIYELVILHI